MYNSNFMTHWVCKRRGFYRFTAFRQNQIVPTEDEEEFRHSILDGYVDDPTAALMGGVAGHAGLFASANDVAILYQMLLNHGAYGGDQYFRATERLICSRPNNLR